MTMIGRTHDMQVALSFVDQGSNVQIAGSTGSGKSLFLSELSNYLSENDWNPLRFYGIAELKNVPLMALNVAAPSGKTGATGPAQLRDAYQQLITLTQKPRSILIIDDIDDLDDASAGILRAVARHNGLVLVSAGRTIPVGGLGGTRQPPRNLADFVVELKPLPFDSFEVLLEARLGSPVESSTASRLFAKSGGIPGLGVTLALAASAEHSLRLREGVWTAESDLWSHSLRRIVEAYLGELDAVGRDALEMLCLVGPVDIETAHQLVGWTAVEALEHHGLVRTYPSNDRLLLTVFPAILVEFFRHEDMSTRRSRLTEEVAERLQTVGMPSLDQSDYFVKAEPWAPVEGSDALFVRVLYEQSRTQRLVAEAEWQRQPSAATSYNLVSALIHSNAHLADIERAIATTDLSQADQVLRARYTCLVARWKAYGRNDVDGALGTLDKAAPQLGEYSRLLDACRVNIQLDLLGAPDEAESLLHVTPGLPSRVTSELHITLAAVHIARAEFAEASSLLDGVGDLFDRPWRTALYRGLAQIGEGKLPDAVRTADLALAEARATLDTDALRVHSYLAIVALTLQSKYPRIEVLLESIMALGTPHVFLQLFHLATTNVAAMVALRSGRKAYGASLVAQLRTFPNAFGPFPAMEIGWGASQFESMAGNQRQASQILWESGQRLWKRHSTFASLVDALTSVELSSDTEHLNKVQSRAAKVDSVFVDATLHYVEAYLSRDAEGMRVAFNELTEVGRWGLAHNALTHLSQYLRDEHRADEAEAVIKERAALVAAHLDDPFDLARFVISNSSLTDREVEIASFVATGQSNRQIAELLRLSIRTVENHVHRIIRKEGLTNRSEIASLGRRYGWGEAVIS
ncbi:helix-turn-helix transcriptional regulator [Lysinibacter cavernae]|uniref:DNA-binding CsgD family transcriptional regulator n=1 Tax=Lysinibacter cavernae TaxID=1640652 RepID=A0A7X5QZ88_9MICO|nr:LuxR C-terminal-related transcriptional regulator [Lysinibacter cavernae]NIH52617.1 DNA-binding CsgD family transcriptional regulator [Lysinibacter cavernae]